ncbi:hypothetical protein FIBSPDRAFT_942661 [Athelia psychrophila]|uniref:Uncharacterized protein n=1 Tax=Athelia psychrophila TaxID=1759441 RepID=A0A166X9A7_9AGAM|nr:hypothetical protein FIBSPDRAFT_942661 [Fibularhizoctonia sp. CBS 109695]
MFNLIGCSPRTTNPIRGRALTVTRNWHTSSGTESYKGCPKPGPSKPGSTAQVGNTDRELTAQPTTLDRGPSPPADHSAAKTVNAPETPAAPQKKPRAGPARKLAEEENETDGVIKKKPRAGHVHKLVPEESESDTGLTPRPKKRKGHAN